MNSTTFCLLTNDGKAEIRGIVEYLAFCSGSLPIVILVPGSGLFDRDVRLGTTGTDADLFFRTISEKLVVRGYAVARFDSRGVKFGGETDNDIRMSVSPDSNAQDFQSVHRYVCSLPFIDPSNVIALAHSEGALIVAHSLEKSGILLKGLVGVGTPLESPATLMRWQVVDRVPDALLSLAANKKGYVSNEDIERDFSKTILPALGICDQFVLDSGGWDEETISALRDQSTAQYEELRGDAKAHAPKDPFIKDGSTYSSYEWWQQWFFDDLPIANRIAGKGTRCILLNFGSIDSQVSWVRQLGFLSNLSAESSLTRISVQERLGHTLGIHPLLGPISPRALERIAIDVDLAVRSDSLSD